MAAYEDKILILIEAVDKTNTVLSDIQKRLQGVKSDTLGWGKMLGGITLGTQLSAGISEVKNAILDATRATLKWSGDMETFGLSIASSLLVGGKYIDQMSGKALSAAESFGMARQQAAGILQELQAANLQTIATLDQLTRVYVETLPIALNKGFNTSQVKDFTLAVVQAAGAIGLEMDMIAEETRAMLTPSINPRFSRVAVSLGLTNEDIRQNSQNADQLFKFLMGRLDAFRLAGEETQRTWKGLWSNLTDIGLQAGAMAMEPVFKSIKGAIEGILLSVVRVNQETKKIEWNPTYLDAFNTIKTGLSDLITLIEALGKAIYNLPTPWNAVPGESEKRDKISKDIDKRFQDEALSGGLSTSSRITRMFSHLNEPGNIWYNWKNNITANDEREFFLRQKQNADLGEEFGTRTRAARSRASYEGAGFTTNPQSIDTMLSYAAKEFNLDPLLLKAQMMRESQGNPLAISPKGAMGLMQIMPQFANEFMDKLVKSGKVSPEYISKFSDREQAAWDPWLNILMGAQQTKFNIDKFGGDIPTALAGYNWGHNRKLLNEKGFAGAPTEVQKYATDIMGLHAKYKAEGMDLMAGGGVTYQGNQKMSKSDIDLAEKSYNTRIKRTKDFVKSETDILESNAKLKLSILEKDHAAGLVSEDDYQAAKTQIMQERNNQEIDLLEKQYDTVYNTFNEARMTNLVESPEGTSMFQSVFGGEGELEREAEKVEATMGAITARIAVLRNNNAIAENQEEGRRAQISVKNMIINDQQATSYTEMANKISTEIDNIKVKFNEMLPGDALVAEHERQIQALVDHIDRLRQIRDEQAEGSTEWTASMEKLVGLYQTLDGLKAKTTYIKKEGGIENASKIAENARAIDQTKAAYAELTGQLDKYYYLTEKATISELEFRKARSVLPEEQAALQDMINYHRELVGIFENYGPAFAGFIDGLREIKKEASSMFNSVKQLVTGIYGDIKNTTTGIFYDLMKGNIDSNKGAKESEVKSRIQNIDLQVEELKNQKEQIEKNDQLTESEKNAQKEAIDARIKQLEAQKDLALVQADAIRNSKSWSEIYDTFLDQITQKIAAFLADATIKAFIAFMTGDWSAFGTGSGGILGLLGGGSGGGGGGGGIMGLVGAGEKGYKAYGWAQKLYNWWTGGSETGAAIGANPALGGDLAGAGGFEAGSLEGLSGAELAGSYGMEAGAGSLGAEAGTGLMAGEFGELGGATYGSIAAEGGAGGAASTGGMGSAMAAVAPYAFAAGYLYTAYKIYQGIQDMAMDDERVGKQQVSTALNLIAQAAGNLENTGPLVYAGEERKYTSAYGVSPDSASTPTPNFKTIDPTKATDTEKIDFIRGYVEEMRLWQKDAKLTSDQIDELTREALGPQNQYLAESIKLMEELDKASIAYIETNDDGMQVMGESDEQLRMRTEAQARAKELMSGMSQAAIEALPNLMTYGETLASLGVTYDTYNSLIIDAALFTNDLTKAQELLADGLSGDETKKYTQLIRNLRSALDQNGESMLSNIPNIERFVEILRELGITLENIPKDTDINVNPIVTPGEPGPPSTGPAPFHIGGFVGKYHSGGLLKYHPWGGGIGADEVPIIAQKGEYVLSRKDVEFIEKVKGGTGVVALPPILPRVNVMVNNQSSTAVESAGAVRMDDGRYIVDVILKDLHSNGRLRRALSFS
jgi:hypothetical protein